MSTVRLAAAQINTVVGDLDGNVERVLALLKQAEEQDYDVLLFPELTLTGYPPEDLLLKPTFIQDAERALQRVAAASGRCLAVVGSVEAVADPTLVGVTRDSRASAGARESLLANVAVMVQGGEIRGVVRKQLLPTYGVFDEQRWFSPGHSEPLVVEVCGTGLGIAVCEDLWASGGPAQALATAGASVICSINASPFARGRRDEREAMVAERVRETGCSIVYVNLVGGQDELIFDGGSFAVTPTGIVARSSQFVEDVLVVDLELPSRPVGPVLVPALSERKAIPNPGLADLRSPMAEVWDALVLGVRDYFEKNGFKSAGIALSGGIDSSIVAAIAVDALGASRVHGIALPSRYSSEGSTVDAYDLANRLAISCSTIPIEPAHTAFAQMLRPALQGEPEGLTDENLQSRIRGLTMMAWSNATGDLVLTTGNKSETAVGYSTLYGDTAGAFAVIKDVVKTLVYELCQYRNAIAASSAEIPPIPEAVLSKPPSAERRPDQRDDQSLPPYEILDRIIEAYVEDDLTAPEIVALGFDEATVNRMVELIDRSEYKRRQSPLGPRVTSKAFGRDRRIPITNRYRPVAKEL